MRTNLKEFWEEVYHDFDIYWGTSVPSFMCVASPIFNEYYRKDMEFDNIRSLASEFLIATKNSDWNLIDAQGDPPDNPLFIHGADVTGSSIARADRREIRLQFIQYCIDKFSDRAN